jgi:phosphate transport system permease protein
VNIKSQTVDKIATVIFYIGMIFVVGFLIFFLGHIIYSGRDKINLEFITTTATLGNKGGGIGLQIFNSIYIVFLSILITLPIGLGAGIYMAEYARDNALTRLMRFCIETLASLPSIVVGLFGMLMFVNSTGWGYTLAGGVLAVSVLNLPAMTRICEDAIKNIPTTYKEASLGLGATKWQTTIKVLVPCAIPSLITGTILISGRVFGEAAAFLYTAGMSGPALDFSNLNPLDESSPFNIFRPAETLAVYIWKTNSEGMKPDARSIADGASAVLMISVLLFNICSRSLGTWLNKKFTGKV